MSPNISPYIFKLFSFYKKSNCLVLSYTSTSSTPFTQRERRRRRRSSRERREKKGAMFSQSLFEDHQDMSSQLGFFSFPPNCNNMGIISTSTTSTLPFIGYNQNTLKTLNMIPPSFDHYLNIESTHVSRHKEDLTTTIFGGPHLLALQKSNPNTW